jgi:WD domain, G-beta repeat.
LKSFRKKQEAVLQGYCGKITSLAASSDNKYFISGSEDKKIKIWNLLKKRQETVCKNTILA